MKRLKNILLKEALSEYFEVDVLAYSFDGEITLRIRNFNPEYKIKSHVNKNALKELSKFSIEDREKKSDELEHFIEEITNEYKEKIKKVISSVDTLLNGYALEISKKYNDKITSLIS